MLLVHGIQREGLKRVYFVLHVCFEKSVPVCVLVSGDELMRLRLAFKRIAGASGVMVKSSFFREVLGESVPPRLAEVLNIDSVQGIVSRE